MSTRVEQPDALANALRTRTRAEVIAFQWKTADLFLLVYRTNPRLHAEELRNRKKIGAMERRKGRRPGSYSPKLDQSPVALTPDDLARAVKRGTITTDTAMKIARGSKRR